MKWVSHDKKFIDTTKILTVFLSLKRKSEYDGWGGVNF